MDILHMKINDEIFEIDLTKTASPHTIETLKSYLPLRIELHYAKIAVEE